MTVAIQQNLDAAVQRRSTLADAIKAEILRLERQAGNLVRVLAEGGDSPAVREELRTIEAGLRGLRIELAGLDQSAPVATPQVDSVLVKARLERLHTLFQQVSPGLGWRLRKHLDGPLTITPALSLAGERRVEIKGRLKPHSLWKGAHIELRG